MNLCDLKEIKRLMEKYGTAPKKGFGQNFLINPMIPQRIAEESVLGFEDVGCALEIGPGMGCLTSCLADTYEKVVALEIDEKLPPLLKESLEDKDNVKVILSDVLKTDLKSLFSSEFPSRPVNVCANLPYYITTPVIMHMIDEANATQIPIIRSMTIMVQSEVADRICALPGSEEYGALSVAVALRGAARSCFKVSPGNFMPAPKVTSSVVRIDLYPNGVKNQFDVLKGLSDELANQVFEKCKKMVSLAFQTRRKTLTNSLSSIISKKDLVLILQKMNLREDIRGEKLSATDFVTLAYESIRISEDEFHGND